MTRRLAGASAIVLVLLTALWPSGAAAIEEADRLWLVGEQAFNDQLHPLARRTLERFVDRYPRDDRVGAALVLLGRARLTTASRESEERRQRAELEAALDAFRRAQTITPRPGHPLEARFWEAEALFRLKRYAEARPAYEEVLRTDMAAPFAADALYGFGWTELQMGRPEPAVTAFKDVLQTWPTHAIAPSAAFYLAQTLADQLKRPAEALPLLEDYPTKYPDSKHLYDVRYLLAMVRIATGDTKRGSEDLKAFFQENPNDPRAAGSRRQATQTAMRSGTPAQLQQIYSALMAEPRPTAETLAEAVGIAGKLGRLNDQEAAAKKLVAAFPKDPLSHRVAFDLAQSAFKRKDWLDSVTWGQAAAVSDDDLTRSESLLIVGEAELKRKRFAAAAKAFEGVDEVKTVDAAIKYRALAGLGLAREEQSDLRAAFNAYDAVAKGSRDAALRQWAQDRASVVKQRMSPKPVPKPKAGS